MAPLLSAATRALAVPEICRAIASVLPQPDLAKASLVDRQWHALLEPELYREPHLFELLDPSAGQFDRILLLVRTLLDRAELKDKVKAVTLWLDEEDQAGGKLTLAALANVLLGMCTGLESVSLAGDDCLAFAGAIPFLVPSPAHLSSLTITPTGINSGGFDFATLGPFLSAFANLRLLRLSNCSFAPDATQQWSTPRFQLTQFELGLSTSQPSSPSVLTSTDLGWLLGSSRYSVRRLSLPVGRREVLEGVIERGDVLERVTIRLAPGCLEGDLGLVDRLAKLPRLERLVLNLAEGSEADRGAIAQAAATVNAQLGGEAVAVQMA